MTVIDRFEGEFAVLETDSGIINVKRSLLPADAREGDVVLLRDGKWETDHDAAEKLRREAVRKLRRLTK